MDSSSRLTKQFKTPQQLIAEIELEKLMVIISQRPLTLEEVKIYDLLCKNLALSEGKLSETYEAHYKKMQTEREKLPEDILVTKALISDAEVEKILQEQSPEVLKKE